MLKSPTGHLLAWIMGLLLVLGLTGCSDDNSSTTTTLTGTAATGAPIAGYVYVKDANGTEVNIATATNGSFTLNVTGMTAPFMLSVVPGNGDPTLYSFASAAGQTVNITPLTNLAMFMANSNADLSAVYDAWDGTGLTSTAIANAQAAINANLQTQLTAAGMDYTTYNFMNTTFSADSTGIDAMLDGLNISVVAGSGFTITNGSGGAVSFNVNIDISGISFAGSGGSSGGSLPDGVAGEIVTMEYCCAASGSPYANGDQVLFTFSSSGMLTLTDQYTVVSNTFTVEGSEYVWTDAANAIKYVLSLNNGAIHEVNVMSTGGTFLGQFAPVVSAASGDQWTLTISGNYDDQSGILVPIGPLNLSGPFGTPDASSVTAAVTTSYGASGNVSVTVLTDTAFQKKFSLVFTGTIGGGSTATYHLDYVYYLIL